MPWKLTTSQNQLLDLTLELQNQKLFAMIQQFAQELGVENGLKISFADVIQSREFKPTEEKHEEDAVSASASV